MLQLRVIGPKYAREAFWKEAKGKCQNWVRGVTPLDLTKVGYSEIEARAIDCRTEIHMGDNLDADGKEVYSSADMILFPRLNADPVAVQAATLENRLSDWAGGGVKFEVIGYAGVGVAV